MDDPSINHAAVRDLFCAVRDDVYDHIDDATGTALERVTGALDGGTLWRFWCNSFDTQPLGRVLSYEF